MLIFPSLRLMQRYTALFSCLLFSFLSFSQTGQDSIDVPRNLSINETNVWLDSLESKMTSEFYKQHYIELLQYSDTAYALAKKIGDPERQFRISRYVGNTLIRMGDTIRAKNVLQRSLVTAREQNDSAAIAQGISDLGNFYGEIGNDDKAIESYLEAIKIIEVEPRNMRQICLLHCNLSEMYLDRNEIKRARYHLTKLHTYWEHTPILIKSGYFLSTGRLHLLEKNYDQAITAFKRNIELAKEADFVDGIVQGYEGYLAALIEKDEYKKAHDIRVELDRYTNKKIEVEKAAAIKEVTARMNVEQYKQELKAKNLENEINRQKANRSKVVLYIVIGASIILSIFLFIILLSSRKRKALVVSLQESNKQYFEAKRKAEELSKVKTNFLSAISHELRTPLYGIIGISSILQQDSKLKRHKEDITSLKFSADYLLALVNDLLFLNKLEVFKKQKLEEKPFDLRELVWNIVNSLEFMRNKNNNAFDIQIAKDVPIFLKGDYVKLSQILINLIGNACKFTEEGIIKVAIVPTKIENNKVSIHFTIADDGIGISQDKQAVIFDEFTQDKKTTSFQGTGLGLAIVKRLLDLHKASISLKSEVNVGTEFQFTIDYLLAEEQEFEIVKKEEKVDKHIEGSHILVVDDNKINRLVTRKILEGNSYVCTTAENGAQAVEITRSEVFDLILMDVNMPVMDGFEATAEIRKFNTNVPILALTATDPSQLGEDLNKIGFTDVIIKPYDTSEFLGIIKKNFLSTIQV